MSVKALWSQNRHIFITAFSIFVVSLGIILFFTPGNGENYLQTDVLHSTGSDGHDVPATPEAEKAHVSTEVNYENLMTIKENPYFVLNKDGKITLASHEFAQMVGGNTNKLKGVFLFDLIAKEHRERVFSHYRDAFANKINVLQTGPFRIDFNGNKSVVFLSFISVPSSDEILIEVNDVTDDLHELDKKLQDTEEKDTDETRVIVKNPSI